MNINTIILVIIGIIFTIYTMRTINGIDNDNFHFTDLLVAVICLAIIVQAKFYDNPNANKYAEAYANGYDDAVHSAELVEGNEDNYYIQFGTFGTSIHEYTYDN